MSSIFQKKEPHPSYHMEVALRWKHTLFHNCSALSLQLKYHCQRQSKLTECPTHLFGFSPNIFSFYNIPGLLGMLSFVSHLSALKKKIINMQTQLDRDLHPFTGKSGRVCTTSTPKGKAAHEVPSPAPYPCTAVHSLSLC